LEIIGFPGGKSSWEKENRDFPRGKLENPLGKLVILGELLELPRGKFYFTGDWQKSSKIPHWGKDLKDLKDPKDRKDAVVVPWVLYVLYVR
jgi:hypothetical protein